MFLRNIRQLPDQEVENEIRGGRERRLAVMTKACRMKSEKLAEGNNTEDLGVNRIVVLKRFLLYRYRESGWLFRYSDGCSCSIPGSVRFFCFCSVQTDSGLHWVSGTLSPEGKDAGA
jgi:hypothetical protein